MSYAEFLARKTGRVEKPGREVQPDDIHPMLHDWQNELVRWAVRTGRAALWADTGMGKTVMQLEWARLSKDQGLALVVAPLAVCQQTVREAAKLGIGAQYVREWSDVDPYDDHLATVYGHKANADYGHLLIETEMGDWVFVYTGSDTVRCHTPGWVCGVDLTADQMRTLGDYCHRMANRLEKRC